MKLRLFMAGPALLLAGCTHTQVTRAPSATPPIFAQQVRNAHNAVDAGDGDYRLNMLRAQAAAEPENADVRLALIQTYRDLSYSDVALEMARAAAARFQGNEALQLSLVRSLRDANLRNEAISVLDAWIKAQPLASASAYSWMGILQDESSHWVMAEPLHRKAVSLAPGLAYLHNNLGYNLLMQSKYDDAAVEFREALRLEPRSAMARNNLAMALTGQGEIGEAAAELQTGTDPASAHSNMAAVLIEKGNYPEARKELEIALGYNRLHPAALKNLDLVSRLEGRPATLPVNESSGTRWERWKAGFVRLFVGPLDDSRTDAGKPATPPREEEP